MLPTDQFLGVCLRQALTYNPVDKRNFIIRRAAYYAETSHYGKVVTEKCPLDKDRAVHYGRAEGSYLSKSVIVITDSERAALLRRIRHLYRSMQNDN